MQLQRSTTHTKLSQANPKWHVIDAEGQRLGRLATKVAQVLQGKHKANFSRHQLTGDFVIVVNASRIEVSGKKLAQKEYFWHTGYLGSLRSRTLEEMLEKHPDRVIESAVKGMLPRNRLGRHMLTRLKVYGGPTHPHEAQVNAGQGKPKQAPAAPARSRTRIRREATVPPEQQAPVTVAEEVTEATAVEETKAEVQEAVAVEPTVVEEPIEAVQAAEEEPAGGTAEDAVTDEEQGEDKQ